MSNYTSAFTEVYAILQELNEEEYNKIPPQVLKAIMQNRNLEYNYELEEDIELKDQPMLPETKAILFNLFRDYLSTPEQKEKIIRMQKDERQKNEIKKQQIYKINIFQEKQKVEERKDKKENVQIIEYKESLWSKMINWIKRLWKKA